MRLARATLVFALAAVALAACGKKDEANLDPAAEQKAAGERARQGPFGGDLKALDKAKGMEADLNQKAQEEGQRADEMSK
ncbi:MAG TPA: hypothetical protein VN598_09660 [Usitatibacter sp.]|nr:hypothetical protein [Usitatibacter sp.]HXS52933.1 hypothetical protein [Usitatibacter sp.]